MRAQKIAGALYIIAVITQLAGESLLKSEGWMPLAVGLNLIHAFAVIAIALLLYPFLKRSNTNTATRGSPSNRGA